MRTRPGRGTWPSRVAVPTRPLRRARGRSPFVPVAGSSPRPSYVARDKSRNDRFAPNFRHHPGIGGHQTPCYVPIPVFTPPGALLDTRGRGHFFAILGGKNPPSCQNIVCYCSPLPRRLHDKKKITKYKSEEHRQEERARGDVSRRRRNFGRETKFQPVRARRDRSDRHGDRHPANGAAREVLTAKMGVPPSYGLHFGYTRPSFTGPQQCTRVHSTGAGGCENRVCCCPSLRGLPPTK